MQLRVRKQTLTITSSKMKKRRVIAYRAAKKIIKNDPNNNKKYDEQSSTIPAKTQLPPTTYAEIELPWTDDAKPQLPPTTYAELELPSTSYAELQLPSTSDAKLELPSSSYDELELKYDETDFPLPKRRKVQAQRKFAQGAFVPPSTSAPERRREIIPKEEHPHRFTQNTMVKMPARSLLDVVSFKSMHSHLQPFVLLKRLPESPIDNGPPPAIKEKPPEPCNYIAHETPSLFRVQRYARPKYLYPAKAKPLHTMKLRSRQIQSAKKRLKNKRKNTSEPVAIRAKRRRVAAPSTSEFSIDDYKPLAYFTKRPPLQTSSAKATPKSPTQRSPTQKPSPPAPAVVPDDVVPATNVEETPAERPRTESPSEELLAVMSSAMDKGVISLADLMKFSCGTPNEVNKKLTDNGLSPIDQNQASSLLKRLKGPYYSSSQIARWVDACRYQSNPPVRNEIANEMFKAPLPPPPALLSKRLERPSLDFIAKGCINNDDTVSVHSFVETPACPSSKYITVKDVLEAPAEEMTARCKKCKPCSRVDKVHKIATLVKTPYGDNSSLTEDIYEFRANDDVVVSNTRLKRYRGGTRQTGSAANASTTTATRSTTTMTTSTPTPTSVDAATTTSIASNSEPKDIPLYLDMLPANSPHIIQIMPDVSDKIMRARLIPKDEATSANELSLVEHENLLDQLMVTLRASNYELNPSPPANNGNGSNDANDANNANNANGANNATDANVANVANNANGANNATDANVANVANNANGANNATDANVANVAKNANNANNANGGNVAKEADKVSKPQPSKSTQATTNNNTPRKRNQGVKPAKNQGTPPQKASTARRKNLRAANKKQQKTVTTDTSITSSSGPVAVTVEESTTTTTTTTRKKPSENAPTPSRPGLELRVNLSKDNNKSDRQTSSNRKSTGSGAEAASAPSSAAKNEESTNRSRNATTSAASVGSGTSTGEPTLHLDRETRSADARPSTSKASFPKCVDDAQLVNAPIFYPTEAEFSDPIAYFEKIMPSAAKFGLCKIVAPAGFNPPCNSSEDIRFNVMNQYVARMYSRWGPAAREMSAIKAYLASQSVIFTRAPLLDCMEVDLPKLLHMVQHNGGLKKVIEKKRWSRVADELRNSRCLSPGKKLDFIYVKYLLPYGTLSHQERQEMIRKVERCWFKKNQKMLDRAMNPLHRQKKLLGESDSSADEEEEEDENVTLALMEAEDCVVLGRHMNLAMFKRTAANMMTVQFPPANSPPTAADVEAEYWKIVLLGTHHVCVNSASIDTGTEGYGFTKNKNDPYGKHPWNLKILSQNPGNVLRSLGPVLGVTVPTLHLGMLYSTSCWHRDPHGLPWIEYMHNGPGKIWYGIPDEQSDNFRKAVEKLCPTSCQNKSIWLPSDITMIPPSLLREHNVSLSRVTQEPGQFIIVFPKAYSCSISTGYTQSESVYFATNSWLNSVHHIFQEVRESCEPTMFSLEQLLVSVARDPRVSLAVLQQVHLHLSTIVGDELANRRALADRGFPVTNAQARTRKQQPRRRAGAWNVREQDECEICRTTLYFSKVTNLTGKKTCVCLQHALQLIDLPKYKHLDVSTFQLVLLFPDAELHAILTNIQKELTP